MDCARNIITANFGGGGTSATTAPLWQWDYGQVLCITGIEDLPAAFEVHFSTNRTGGVSTTAVGADGQVTIPNVLLTIGKNLNAWIYLSDAQGEGETEYSILIPVKSRPMPETYDAEVSGEFDDVVRQMSEYAETAQTAADNAGASASAAAASADSAAASASTAESAKTAAETAQGKAEDAQAAAETAAQAATQKAQQTAQDAAQAAQSKADAESAAGRAEAAQTGAESAKTDAKTAAQGAADSALAASASASNAGQAATSAAQSATAAAGSATTAGNSAQTATTKAGEASASASAAAASETAAQTAQSAAETAATTATAKATEAAASATAAAQAAASINTPDSALSDTSTNAVQNKVITGELTQVKSAITKLTPAATDADVGKALIVKAVADGKPTEYEYGEAGGGGGTVDDALSDTSTNPVENRAVTNAIRALQIEDTASGAIASFPDGAAMPIKSLTVDMSPIQTGSGDPSPDNIRPITGRDSVTVTRTGKNVWDEEWEYGLLNTNGSVGESATRITTKNFVPVIPGESYCMRITMGGRGRGAFYADDKTLLAYYSDFPKAQTPDVFPNNGAITAIGDAWYFTFIAPPGAKWMKYTLYPNAIPDGISINYPSTDHDYHAYDAQSVTIQLGQTVYGGTVDVITGKATIAWKKYIGSAFAAASARTGGFYSRVLLGGETYAGGQVTPARYACNMAVKERDLYDKWYYYAAGNLGGTVSYVHMYIPESAIDYHEGDNITTLLNAAYNASDFEFILPIPEPFDIDITPASLSTLKGDNTVWSDGDSVEMTYIADPKLYINKVVNA